MRNMRPNRKPNMRPNKDDDKSVFIMILS